MDPANLPPLLLTAVHSAPAASQASFVSLVPSEQEEDGHSRAVTQADTCRGSR